MYNTDKECEYILRNDAKDDIHFIWVHYTEWNYLYGLYSGGPVFPRCIKIWKNIETIYDIIC